MKMKWFHRNKREQPLFHESLPTSESNDSKSPDWWQSIKIPILHFIRHNMPQIRKLFQQLILTVVVIRRRVVRVNVSVAVSMTKMIVFMIAQLCFHLTRAPIGQYSVSIHNTQLWLVDTRMNWICDDSCEIWPLHPPPLRLVYQHQHWKYFFFKYSIVIGQHWWTLSCDWLPVRSWWWFTVASSHGRCWRVEMSFRGWSSSRQEWRQTCELSLRWPDIGVERRSPGGDIVGVSWSHPELRVVCSTKI